MAAGSAQVHEPLEQLRVETLDRHRATVSLMEELEAIDWYDQRIDAADDPELAAILAHNRDEEKEHASMLLEWLRRRDPVLDGHLRRYLFSEGPIELVEARAEAATARPSSSLGIGALRAEGVL
jgi:uncharacterized protein